MNSDKDLLNDALKEIESLRQEIARLNRQNSALSQSLEQYRQFHDDLPLCYLELDESGSFNEINTAFLNLLGYAKEDVIGRNFSDFLATEEDRAYHYYSFPIFKETGAITNVRWQFKSANGEVNTAVMHSRARYDADNNFLNGHGILVKISKGTAEESERLSIDVESILSPREHQVFEMLGKGARSKEIAETLNISTKTVENFRENIKRKLNLQSAPELIRFAIEWVHR